MIEPLRKGTILLVDDEANILSSLTRVLRNEPYHLLKASNGEEGLQIMESHSVDLVISDARMPGMDGAMFLSLVQTKWPETMRILLTGYADITTTIDAINEGRIYRYISKPWNDDELRQVIRQGLDFQFSERERVRLEKVIHRQNRSLRQLNANLESQVASRTEELKQTAEMVDAAYEELKNGYATATEVFSSLLSQRFPKHQHTNSQVIALVKAYAEAHDLSEEATRDLTMAGALYNIGKLTWDDQLLNTPYASLSKEEMTRYRAYPELGESLLMALEPLKGAAKIIRYHQERWDGSGFPLGLEGEVIPFGSRLLKLAVDFVELQCGMIVGRQLSQDETLQGIGNYAGKVYDPKTCTQFIALCRQAPKLQPTPRSRDLIVATQALKPGMVITRNLYATNGSLLLNEGKELTANTIEKLIAFEKIEGAKYKLAVRLPEGSTAASLEKKA